MNRFLHLKVPSQLGDLKPEDLSGPEALLNPGKLTNTFSVILCHFHVEATTLDNANSDYSVRNKQLPTCLTQVKFAGLLRLPLGQAEIHK